MVEKGNCDIDAIKAGVENEVETIKKKIGLPESSNQRDFKLSVLSFDYDSYLNSEKWKAKLRKVGLCDELDVGRWIAEKLEDQYELHDLSQTFLKYIENKESSTLHPCLKVPLFLKQNKETIKTKKRGKVGRKQKKRKNEINS
ncbi:uncharacterized protein LOC124434999 [Xenia sp. Carnegie-2017]|uniref:uncharacterized protein LOC124434999 n=1 Tax=Xenia sp. Carnegie-2017 TaxID=2897299 RepID=UPI001F03CCF3|nr:uncharacterized protein LOC124434999 [Xenia sp. Carnegie-2017]